MLHCFVNVPKIPIIKMKNKKHLLVQYSTFMLICVVLKLFAVISLPRTFFLQKRFQFRVDLHLVTYNKSY